MRSNCPFLKVQLIIIIIISSYQNISSMRLECCRWAEEGSRDSEHLEPPQHRGISVMCSCSEAQVKGCSSLLEAGGQLSTMLACLWEVLITIAAGFNMHMTQCVHCLYASYMYLYWSRGGKPWQPWINLKGTDIFVFMIRQGLEHTQDSKTWMESTGQKKGSD